MLTSFFERRGQNFVDVDDGNDDDEDDDDDENNNNFIIIIIIVMEIKIIMIKNGLTRLTIDCFSKRMRPSMRTPFLF